MIYSKYEYIMLFMFKIKSYTEKRVLFSVASSLGDFFSRQYSGSGWSVSSNEANMKTISFMIVGALLSSVSGIGLVLLTVKNIFDV